MKIPPQLEAAHPTLRDLMGSGRPEEPEIQAFLDRHAFPLADGPRRTFVYRGEADRVALRHWVQGTPPTLPFQRLPGTDLWFLVLEPPEDARIEYKLEITRGGGSRLLEDPLNPLRARDPFGANSVFHAHGYEPPDWTRPHPEVLEGRLEERVIRSRFLPGRRRLTIYRPAEYRQTRRHPLLIVHDGRDHLRFADLRVVLDNLIHRREIPPLVATLIDPCERLEEYVGSDAHARFLLDELVPRLETRLPLMGAPAGRCLAGASLGAVASLHAAASRPGFFGALLLQSGSFTYSSNGGHGRGPVFDRVAAFVDRFRSEPVRASHRVFLSCGAYEPLVDENRAMLPVLRNAGMQVRYVEARDGHNWQNWRDRLKEGLSWVLPDTDHPTEVRASAEVER